jgi:predicted signal transduction protein with EAL and GGDEF domain
MKMKGQDREQIPDSDKYKYDEVETIVFLNHCGCFLCFISLGTNSIVDNLILLYSVIVFTVTRSPPSFILAVATPCRLSRG